MPRGHPRITQSVYYDGPPIPLDKDDIAHRKDAKLGSAILREACLDLFCRTANRHQVSMDDAMASHLGYHARPVVPGMERVLKTSAAMRLAA